LKLIDAYYDFAFSSRFNFTFKNMEKIKETNLLEKAKS